jgi:hypothetical protein
MSQHQAGWAPPIDRFPRVGRVRPVNTRLWDLIEREHAKALTPEETEELNALCSQLEDEGQAA